MIILGNKKSGGALANILDKMKNSHGDYESLKSENEKRMEEKPESETDCKEGMDAEVNKMMSAFESKDVESFKSALKSFITMVKSQD